MKWQSQRRKVEALSAQASLLSVQSHILKQELHDRAIEQLRKPEAMVWAFAAGVFWIENPAAKRLGSAQSLLKLVSTAAYILRLLGIPLPARPPF